MAFQQFSKKRDAGADLSDRVATNLIIGKARINDVYCRHMQAIVQRSLGHALLAEIKWLPQQQWQKKPKKQKEK